MNELFIFYLFFFDLMYIHTTCNLVSQFVSGSLFDYTSDSAISKWGKIESFMGEKTISNEKKIFSNPSCEYCNANSAYLKSGNDKLMNIHNFVILHFDF